MNPKTFIGEFLDRDGEAVRMEFIVDMDSVKEGQFQYSISGDPFRIRKVAYKHYVSWVKSTIAQLAKELGRNVVWKSQRDGCTVTITGFPDGTTDYRKKKI